MNSFRLWAACLALLPLAVCPAPASAQAPPPAPPAQSPPAAAPVLTGLVTKISIVGLKNISLDTVQAKLTLKVGDAYTPESAQKDLDALQSMGVFQPTMSVSATQRKIVNTTQKETVSATQTSLSGVAVTYTGAENPVVQSIKFTANTPSGEPSVPWNDLFVQMKTRVGQVLNTNTLRDDLDSLFNHTGANNGYVTKQGYLMDVSSDINIDPKTGVLTIPLIEYFIKSIEVAGNSRVKTAGILAQMHSKTSDIFDNNSVNKDVDNLYETGDFRTVNYTISSVHPGDLDLKINVVEQEPATGSLNEKQGKIIPFLYDPLTVPTPVVEVSVNGHSPLPFIVDTGTTPPLLLAPWAAKKLGLKPSSLVEKADNFTYSRVPIKGIVLEGSTHSSDAAFNTREAFVTDWSLMDLSNPRPRIAGVVGMGTLVSATSRFDFAAKTLTIWTTPHLPLDIPSGITLPLRLAPSKIFTVHVVLAPNTAADLVLDTGSSNTQVPLPVLPALHPTATSYSSFTETVDGAVYLCPEVRLPKITIGKAQVLNTLVGTLPATIPQSLGMDVLAGYRMTLDGPNAQLILEPSAHNGRYELGFAGVFVKQSGAGWAIKKFEKGSPAQKAGLKAGDRVLAVNNVNVAGTQQLFCEHLLDGLIGHQIQVTVQRESSKLAIVSWTATNDINSPSAVVDGLPMQKPLGGPWMILEVIKGCPGDKVGLLAGDTLTKIDGEATAAMSLERFAELVKKPSVLVEVERPGVAQPFSVRLTLPKPPH